MSAASIAGAADPVSYPPAYAGLPAPLPLPFVLKPLSSARTGVDKLPDGRMRYWIEHDVLRGVMPKMLAWWFANLEGELEFEGRRYNRYRFWHPRDHAHVSYARRRPDGSIGPGASIRLIEVLGRNPHYLVDTVSHIERLDEGGYVHCPEFHGVRGFARMEYTFEAVEGGTLYRNALMVGGEHGWRRWLNPLVNRFGFDRARGEAWLLHNIEEVGMFENFLPALYRSQTGLGN